MLPRLYGVYCELLDNPNNTASEVTKYEAILNRIMLKVDLPKIPNEESGRELSQDEVDWLSKLDIDLRLVDKSRHV